MITFYEGLPRAGKTYSAVKDVVIPALQSGRQVFAYIDGLDPDKCAAFAGVDVEIARGLLKVLSRDQVKLLPAGLDNDALVVIDEAQGFWPTQRGKLSEEVGQFVAEHGHRGMDVVLIGQSMKDVHPLWRRRVERRYVFTKKSAIGKPDSFFCTISSCFPDGQDVRFETLQSLSAKYDPRVFDLYRSHVAGVENKATQVDDRAVIWRTPLFRFWLPLAGVSMLVALFVVVGFFRSGLKAPDKVAAAPVAAVRPEVERVPEVSASSPVVAERRYAPVEPPDMVEELNSRARARLVGFVRIGSRIEGLVEWRDGAMNLIQSLSFRDLSGLGWVVMVNTSGTLATMTRGPRQVQLSAWPIDRREGRASDTQLASVSGVRDLAGSVNAPAASEASSRRNTRPAP